MEESVLTSGKRHCGEYCLHLVYSANIALDRPEIVEFFSPIVTKSLKIFPQKPDSTFWRADFDSSQDKDKAMAQKQWQYIGRHSIRLIHPDEHGMLHERRKWGFIHRDLQVDILSHFDVFQRCRLRRVCGPWNSTLETLWDGDVNRCLYFKFKAMNGNNIQISRDNNIRALRHAHEESRNLCGKIPRVVLHFEDGTTPVLQGVIPGEEYLEDLQTNSQFFDEFLVRHSHFKTVMLIGIWMKESMISEELFRFGCTTRWPRTMKIIFDKCYLSVEHTFPAPTEDNVQLVDDVHGFVPNGHFTDGYVVTLDVYEYTILLHNFQIQIDEISTKTERLKRIHREVDRQRLLFPYPPEQLEWLKSVLMNVPLDEDSEALAAMNAEGRYSVRQAIRQYLKTDVTRRIVGPGEPTGVFFEKFELSWRDCFLLGALTAQDNMLISEAPPCEVLPEMGCFDVGPLYDNKNLEEEPALVEKFNRKVALLCSAGPHHITYPTDIMALLDAESEEDEESDEEVELTDEEDEDDEEDSDSDIEFEEAQNEQQGNPVFLVSS